MTQKPSLFDLSGRVAVVTGGNGGLGRGMALGLARAGASVAVIGRDEKKNHEVLSELQSLGVPCFATPLDITDRNALRPTLTAVERALGPIDILVNNAGIFAEGGNSFDAVVANWDITIETNLSSVFLMSQCVAESMRERRRGKIINIASMMSIFGAGNAIGYSASKGGVMQLTKSLAIALAPHNIQVNAIAPGFIRSNMCAPPPDSKAHKEITSRTPAGRLGEPDELAGAAIFLASSAADFITGTMIPVDGGYSIR